MSLPLRELRTKLTKMTFLPKHILFRIWNFWPPFLGAGIRIDKVSPDYREVIVSLNLRPWTKNYVGTQYGGSMFSMTDPFYMVMLLQNLGRNYIVWDQAASIRYLKPGRTKLTARFHLNDEILESIRKKLEVQEKINWTTVIQIQDLNGQIIAEVEKVLYIRRKSP